MASRLPETLEHVCPRGGKPELPSTEILQRATKAPVMGLSSKCHYSPSNIGNMIILLGPCCLNKHSLAH